MNLKKYRKALVAVAGAVVALAVEVLPDLGVNADVVQVLVTLATAFGVYQVPNEAA